MHTKHNVCVWEGGRARALMHQDTRWSFKRLPYSCLSALN
jgi:hypothetical protein